MSEVVGFIVYFDINRIIRNAIDYVEDCSGSSPSVYAFWDVRSLSLERSLARRLVNFVSLWRREYASFSRDNHLVEIDFASLKQPEGVTWKTGCGLRPKLFVVIYKMTITK